MAHFISSHPCTPTSPTQTLKSENNVTLDYLDPFFADNISSNIIGDLPMRYNDQDMPSPSSSIHDTSSALTTPSPGSQYDVLNTDKYISPADLLTTDNPSMLHSTLQLSDTYHHIASEHYSPCNNIFNIIDHSSNQPPLATRLNNTSALLDEVFQLRVLGIPNRGAKSRVETQIKLVIQLLSSSGAKAPNWSYLRLPEHLLARSKLRKTHQQQLQKQMDGSIATIVSDESKVLTLDAKVICSTDAEKSVRMCDGCVRREASRKRAERTKDGKPRHKPDTHSQVSQQQSNYNVEDDHGRILLFNCSSMVNFSSGDAILPTRITCYCRHHNEKVGFRIQFTLRDYHDYVVAEGCSPPIMITDDHKSSKHRSSNTSNPNIPNDTSMNMPRKRGRADYDDQRIPDTPALSPRGSLPDNNVISTTTTPCILNPSASFGIPSSASDTQTQDLALPSPDAYEPSSRQPSASPQMFAAGSELPTMAPIASTETQHSLHTLHQNNTPPPLPPHGTFVNVFNSTPTNDIGDQNGNLNIPINSYNNNNSNADGNEAWHNNRRRRIMNNGGDYTSDDPSGWQSELPHPQLERLVPTQGPTYGGVEVTILGSGFYHGLTCLFGEYAASTVYWNPNTLVCVLPPAATPGPVVVSFKEHPIVLEGQDVALFTYYDASDQALLELALQVVGLKMTGKLHDAKHIAMLIVRGDQQKSQQQQRQHQHQQQQQHQSQHQIQSFADASDEMDDGDSNQTPLSNDTGDDTDSLDVWLWREGDNLESHIINALGASDAHDIMHTNTSGHTMLHLAVLLRYGALAKVLLSKMSIQAIDSPDRNGCTPLHFACLQNNGPMVQLLLDAGAQSARKCNIGSTLELATDGSVRSLLLRSLSATLLLASSPTSSNSVQATPTSSSSSTTLPPLQRRHSFKSHLRKFYTLKPRSDHVASGQVVDNLDNNGLGFAQYKHDRRLYLFWLPLLIVTIGLLYYQVLGDRTLMTLLQDMIPFRRHGLSSTVGY